MAHERIARIAIIHRADLPCRPRDFDNLFAFFDGHRHGFLAKDVKPALEKGFGDLKMRRVGSGDSDKINRVVLCFFAGQHILPTAIGAIAQSKAAAIADTFFGPMIQGACRELKQPVEPRTQTMSWPDLAAFTAANHAPL